MACVLAVGIGLLLAIGGFGGTLKIKHPAVTITGGAGAVIIVLGFLINC